MSDIDDIVKIEKQVKDLTLSELEKLNLEPMYNKTNDKLIYVVSKGIYNKEHYELIDYIDVTAIYKEVE